MSLVCKCTNLQSCPMSRTMRVTKCPEAHSRSNRAVVNPADFGPQEVGHINVRVANGGSFVFSIVADASVPAGEIGFSMPQRKWAQLSVGQDIGVGVHKFDKSRSFISAAVLEVDFFTKKNSASEEYNTDDMAKEFQNQFANLALTQA